MGKKEIRNNFRNSVFKRDNNECKLCGRSDIKLDAHHITNREEIDNGGYVTSNGITLCDDGENGCHFKVETFYFSELRDSNLDNPYHPNELYKLINSSLEIARQDAIKLK